jgi:hypothetical protein
MKIYKYHGNNRQDPWFTQHPWNWWSWILIKLIRPIETCVLCKRSVMKVLRLHPNDSKFCMHVSEDFILCGECGQKYKIIKK